MILNIDKWSKDAVAAIDSQSNQLTYGELRYFAEETGKLMLKRSLFFMLVENNVGGIACREPHNKDGQDQGFSGSQHGTSAFSIYGLQSR